MLVGGLKDPLHGSTAADQPSKPSRGMQPASHTGASLVLAMHAGHAWALCLQVH